MTTDKCQLASQQPAEGMDYKAIWDHATAIAKAVETIRVAAAPPAQAQEAPVAFTLRSRSDGSYFRDGIAIVGYTDFDERMFALKEHPWVEAGRASVVPLYAHPAPSAEQRLAYVYEQLAEIMAAEFPGPIINDLQDKVKAWLGAELMEGK